MDRMDRMGAVVRGEPVQPRRVEAAARGAGGKGSQGNSAHFCSPGLDPPLNPAFRVSSPTAHCCSFAALF